MVRRLQRPVLVVFDFDGTLIPFNSFKPFLLLLFVYCAVSGRFRNMHRLSSLLLARKFGELSHMDFKRSVCEIYDGMNQPFSMFFSKILIFCLRAKVFKEFKAWKNRDDITTVLSTAAPVAYARRVGEALGFDVTIGCFGFSTGGFLTKENLGADKAMNLRSYFNPESDLSIVAAYSDSHEDIPLFQLSERRVLVQPGKRDLARLNELKINYEIL